MSNDSHDSQFVDSLGQSVREQARKLCQEVISEEGKILPERLESLLIKKQLLDLCGTGSSKRLRNRWPAIAVVLIIATILSVLFFMRLPSMQIELVATASGVSFSSAGLQKLSDTIVLVELGIIGIDAAQIPENEENFLAANWDSDLAIRLSKSSQRNEGTISLGEFFLEPTSKIELRSLERSRVFRISFEGQPTKLSVSIDGSVSLSVAGRGTQLVNNKKPKSLTLTASKGLFSLDLTLPKIPMAIGRDLMVNGLSFNDVEQHDADAERTIVSLRSMLLSGTIYMESLSGEELVLRQGQRLSFISSEGVIRDIVLRNNHIEIGFHGRVQGMTTGVGDTRRSLMPTYIEWLAARHSLALFWGGLLSAVGFIFGILKWWGIKI